MVKAGKWIKSILIGVKKDKNKVQKDKQNSSNNPNCDEIPTTPIVITPATPKEKKRWSFRRSSATAPKDSNSNEPTRTKPDPPARAPESPNVELKVAEADATNDKVAGPIQEAAAIKIQSVFKSYLARKALRALRGLVKLQALVRGRLVRKRATATLRCMEALITAQARARANRIRCAEERKVCKYNNHRQFTCRVNGEDYNFNNSYHEVEKGMVEENIKVVEMDIGEAKFNPKTRNSNNYSYYQTNGTREERFSSHYASDSEYAKRISPAPSAVTDTSPRACSGHFEDYYAFTAAQSSPQCYDYYPLNPSYMANTQSSRAKARRSQSAPKQRPPSKRRPSLEGRNIPRAVRMQRSSSNVGPTSQSYYHYPCSIKLDKSSVSLIGSECGSNCSVLTTTNYCRSQVPYEHQGHRY